MSRMKIAGGALLCMLALLRPDAKAWAQQDDAKACDQAARVAEGEFGLPAGVLVAIGSVESGRWPWTANVDGAAETYQSKAEAITALTRIRTPRPADVDVGCFQISLHYHPAAFATIADALDPTANARYAARFLRELRDKYGDWDRAVGAYHSATGGLEAGYRERVIAQWKGPPAPEPLQVAAAPEQPRWRIISIADSLQPVAGGRGLPRIITLSN
jgi:hypothetical protein